MYPVGTIRQAHRTRFLTAIARPRRRSVGGLAHWRLARCSVRFAGLHETVLKAWWPFEKVPSFDNTEEIKCNVWTRNKYWEVWASSDDNSKLRNKIYVSKFYSSTNSRLSQPQLSSTDLMLRRSATFYSSTRSEVNTLSGPTLWRSWTRSTGGVRSNMFEPTLARDNTQWHSKATNGMRQQQQQQQQTKLWNNSHMYMYDLFMTCFIYF